MCSPLLCITDHYIFAPLSEYSAEEKVTFFKKNYHVQAQ